MGTENKGKGEKERGKGRRSGGGPSISTTLWDNMKVLLAAGLFCLSVPVF